MIISKLACPSCKTILKSAKPIPAGKQIACAKCQHRFVVTVEMLQSGNGEASRPPSDVELVTRLNGPGSAPPRAVTVMPVSPPRPAPPPQSGDDFDMDDRDDVPPLRRRTPQKSAVGLVVMLSLLVLAVGGGITAAVILLNKKDDPARPPSTPVVDAGKNKNITTTTPKKPVDPKPQKKPLEHWLRELKAETEEARTAAADALVKDYLDELGEMANNGKTQADRLTALEIIAGLGPRAAPTIPAVGEALKDPDTSVRLAAALTLGKVGPTDQTVKGMLFLACTDRDAQVSKQARALLATLYPDKNGDPTIKQVALQEKKKDIPKDSPEYLTYVNEKEQRRIDTAVAKGVKFLLEIAPESGRWRDLAPPLKGQEAEEHHTVGYTALPALALLECKVEPTNAVIRKAAEFVRAQGPKITDTYSLGLAVVFLDRLGDAQDKGLIRTLAMRLVAGQTPAGGWHYHCPILTPADEQSLFNFMKVNKPKFEFFNPIQGKPGASVPVQDGVKASKVDGPGAAQAAQEKPAADTPLPGKLNDLPVVVNKRKKSKTIQLVGVRDDNSNTQFGILGLWAARRHDVPTELSLEMAAERFRQTQAPDGGWSYAPPVIRDGKIQHNPTKNTMMCVGLLGLAMGHGAAAEAFLEAQSKGKAAARPPMEDKNIKEGLHGLGEYINGEDKDLRGLESRLDLYYLWTLERVGMLYHQRTIGKRDWYRWGANIILEKQGADGSWQFRYETGVDTAFALLFLKRSNLVKDLTQNLQLYIAIPKQ